MSSGTLLVDFNANNCALNEGVRTRPLARVGNGNIFVNAFNFVVGTCQLNHGQQIDVDDGPGTTNAVIFVLNARPAVQPIAATGRRSVRKARTTKKAAAKRSKKKATSKPTKKQSKASTKKASTKVATRKKPSTTKKTPTSKKAPQKRTSAKSPKRGTKANAGKSSKKQR